MFCVRELLLSFGPGAVVLNFLNCLFWLVFFLFFFFDAIEECTYRTSFLHRQNIHECNEKEIESDAFTRKQFMTGDLDRQFYYVCHMVSHFVEGAQMKYIEFLLMFSPSLVRKEIARCRKKFHVPSTCMRVGDKSI